MRLESSHVDRQQGTHMHLLTTQHGVQDHPNPRDLLRFTYESHLPLPIPMSSGVAQ